MKFFSSFAYSKKDLNGLDDYKIEALPDGEYFVFLLPKNSTLKDRIEASLNLFAEIAEGLSNSKPNYGEHITKDGMHIQFTHAMKRLGMFAGYLLNSTSWQDQEVKEFDIIEFNNRLTSVIETLKAKNYT